MNLIETNAFLTWLSQHDGRIKVTDPSVQIWADALAHATSAEVRQATLDHYRANETIAATPALIRRMAYAIRERAIAQQSALEAGPTTREVTYDQYVKHMDRPEFQALMAQGARQHQAELHRKGIL